MTKIGFIGLGNMGINMKMSKKDLETNRRRRVIRGSAKENQTERSDQQGPQVRKQGIKTRVDLYENSYRKVMFHNENMHRDSWQNSYRDHLMFPRKQVTNHSTYDGW